MSPYEFALLRYVHDLSAGEFANVGVILFEPGSTRVHVRASERYARLSEFFRGVNGAAYRSMLRQVEHALSAINEEFDSPELLASPPHTLSEILARVFPEDESCFRVSSVMYGVSETPQSRVDELFLEFVAKYDASSERERRSESDIRRDLERKLVRSDLGSRIKFNYPVQSANYEYTFQAGWQNGRPQVLEPISFDLLESTNIIEKANTWSGRLYTLSKGADFGFIGVIAPPKEPTLQRAFDKATAILEGTPAVRRIVIETKSEAVLEQIRADTQRGVQPA